MEQELKSKVQAHVAEYKKEIVGNLINLINSYLLVGERRLDVPLPLRRIEVCKNNIQLFNKGSFIWTNQAGL